MRKAFIYLLLCLLAPALHAQEGKAFLQPVQERDSILIADQVLYGFQLEKVEEGTRFVLPEWKNDPQSGGVMFLGSWITDTLKVKKQKKGMPKFLDLRYAMVLTSFDEGLYELPEIVVQRTTGEGVTDTLRFEPLAMDVKTIQIDTTTFEPHDIKAQMRYPVTPDEVLPWVGLYWLVALAVIMAVCIINIRKRRGSPEYARKDPPHIVALRTLDRYRGSSLWVPEKQKTFYSGVTDALREYISDRYGIAAMEMTTAEIFEDMKKTDAPKALLDEMRDLFERADFVKFAKHLASDEENASVLPLAVRFVTSTYQTDIESEGAAGEGGESNDGGQK